MENHTCLSYWFPAIEAAGLPVPRTTIIKTKVDLASVLDGKQPDWGDLLKNLSAAAMEIGLPCFLRTGMGSGKHRWSETCHLTDLERLPSHITALVEWSHLVDFIGLEHDVWVVREMLPTIPAMELPRYKGMPLCREFRYFVRDSDVLCCHPYWPEQAVIDGLPIPVGGDPRKQLPVAAPDFEGIYRRLTSMTPSEGKRLHEIATAAGARLGGYWSVDILETRNGWYLTDMAEGERSFHWEGCAAKQGGA